MLNYKIIQNENDTVIFDNWQLLFYKTFD